MGFAKLTKSASDAGKKAIDAGKKGFHNAGEWARGLPQSKIGQAVRHPRMAGSGLVGRMKPQGGGIMGFMGRHK